MLLISIKGRWQLIITAIIANDLQNSGYFNVTPFPQLNQFPHTIADVDIPHWQQLAVDNVVVGQVVPVEQGKFTVTVSLLNVFQGSRAKQRVLFNHSYTVDKMALRQIAHHISDQIYVQLTGKQGVFSTRIAYIVVVRRPTKPTQYRLEIADVDGYAPKAILTSTQPIMSPAWSPDGKSIAYVSFENKHAQIYINDVATGQRRLISNYPGINGAPSWSPDGKQLALVLSKDGYPNIYTLNLANRQLQQITRDWSIDTEPVWARDGKSLYFTSDRGGAPQIYQINLANKRIQRVTFSGRFNARASLSIDGEHMALLHRQGTDFNVAVYDLANDTLTPLTNAGHHQSPAIAPNGSLVMYATRFAGKDVLEILSTDGDVSLRLPAREGDVQEPAWSPFLS